MFDRARPRDRFAPGHRACAHDAYASARMSKPSARIAAQFGIGRPHRCPVRLKAVGRRADAARQIEALLMRPHYIAVAARRKCEIAADKHAALRRVVAHRSSIADARGTGSSHTSRSLCASSRRASSSAAASRRASSAGHVSQLAVEMILERAEQRVVMNPVGIFLDEVVECAPLRRVRRARASPDTRAPAAQTFCRRISRAKLPRFSDRIARPCSAIRPTPGSPLIEM